MKKINNSNNINSLRKSNPQIINIVPENPQQTVAMVAAGVRESVDNGYNNCTFKFEDYDYKQLLNLIDMLKQASYQVVLLSEDIKRYNTMVKVYYLNTTFPNNKG